MGNIARIFVGDGTLTFDADVPYDRQLLFEQARYFAERRGSITLDLDGVEWSVRRTRRPRARCTECGDRLPSISYARQQRLLCPRCASELCLLPGSRTAPIPKPPRRQDTRHQSIAHEGKGL